MTYSLCRMLARTIMVPALLAAAPPALALYACFTMSTGPWRGPVWNGIGLQTSAGFPVDVEPLLVLIRDAIAPRK